MSDRITGINLYRRYIKTDGTGDIEFKLIKEKRLRPMAQFAILDNGLPSFTFTDVLRDAPSYSSVNNII